MTNKTKGIALVAITMLAASLVTATMSLAPMNVMATTTDETEDEDGPAYTSSITINDENKEGASSDKSENAAAQTDNTLTVGDSATTAGLPAHTQSIDTPGVKKSVSSDEESAEASGGIAIAKVLDRQEN